MIKSLELERHTRCFFGRPKSEAISPSNGWIKPGWHSALNVRRNFGGGKPQFGGKQIETKTRIRPATDGKQLPACCSAAWLLPFSQGMATVKKSVRHRPAKTLKAASPVVAPFNHSGSTPLSSDWLVWQLVDSAFPTGGFAHSLGLEAAWQHGEVRNRADLISFAEAGLQQLGRAALPLVLAVFNEPERLAELDQLCDAFTSNHVANRASRAQGRAFLTAVERIFKSEIRNPKSEIVFAHFAPVFGFCLRQLNVPRQTAARMFFFNQLRSVLAAAVRLNIVGPMEAQILQQRLAIKAEEILVRCETLTLDDLAQTSPLLDLWQGAQDRLYSRLFQS